MKHDTFDKYAADAMDLPQRALLTTWDCLSAYRDDLVLVGGLAIRHLTKPPEDGMLGPVTLDVDFGISIGAGGSMYGSIRETLSAHGFKWEDKRFVRKFKELTLFVDLLTDDGESDTGTVVVDDSLSVGVVPGINRALEQNRLITVSGTTLIGVPQTEEIRVAEAGPLLVLKLNAFGGPVGRKANKDVHDILYLAMNYLDGTHKAVSGFHEEKRVENRGMRHAVHALKNYFQGPEAQGPMACAAFRLNNRHMEPEFQEESERIRQQCVTLAEALLA
ncbi:MAG: nucleotidyl transferase AbiEii/AbiGii toxin family protein [Verrucomicrobia bacterium]|nr:nucleotidyl transferase AbiEii/AbiGii toxin family protein [Verrucomicrobiota bacterium]